MITGKTTSGFKFKIPDGLGEDFRLVKAYRDVRNGDEEQKVDAAINLVSVIFANDNEEKRFYEHLASKNGGRVPSTVLFKELLEIVTIATEKDKEAKNS